jgi:hypothetical protein
MGCPVPGCVGRDTIRANLQAHFAHQHPTDSIIVEEGDLLQQCTSCMMFLSTANTPAHLETKWGKQGTVCKRKRELEREYLCGMEVQIYVSGTVIELVDCFR